MDWNGGQPKLSIDELAERTGVPTRTIRYYITTRLLTGPTSRGKQASYSIDHVLRLRLIRKLTARHVPLEEIATRLEGLTATEIEALLVEEDGHAALREETSRHLSPRAYIESLLRRSAPAAPLPAYPEPPISSPMQIPAPAPQPDRPATIPAPTPLPPQAASTPRLGSAPATPFAGSTPPWSPRTTAATRQAPGVKETAWKRWELAPGLELYVEIGREAEYRERIDALLRLAATTED